MIPFEAEIVHEIIAVAGSDFFRNMLPAELFEVKADLSILVHGGKQIAPDIGLRLRFLDDILWKVGKVVSHRACCAHDPSGQNLAAVLGVTPIRCIEEVLHVEMRMAG